MKIKVEIEVEAVRKDGQPLSNLEQEMVLEKLSRYVRYSVHIAQENLENKEVQMTAEDALASIIEETQNGNS